MTADFDIAVLAARHDRKKFNSGVAELDRYLQRQAGQDLKRRLAVPYVMANSEGRIAGYYTLSNFAIELADLPEKLAAKLPYPRVPAALLGRLAVDREFRGQGFGEHLLMDALSRSAAQSRQVGSWALVVHAKDESAFEFYRKYGFLPFPGNPLHLFLPMKTIVSLFG